MKTCAICKHEIKDGEQCCKYWIPEIGEWCCDSCMKFSDECNKEIDAELFRLLESFIKNTNE